MVRISLILLLVVLSTIPLGIIGVAEEPFTEKWRLSVEGPVYHLKFTSDETGVIFAVSSPPKVYVIGAMLGSLSWTYEFNNKSMNIEVADLHPDENHFAVLAYWSRGEQYYFNVKYFSVNPSGMLWETKPYVGGGWDLKFLPDGSAIIVSTASNYLLALDPSSGRELWRLDLPVDATYNLALYGNKLYVGGFVRETRNGAVLCVDLDEKKVLWVNKDFEDSVLVVAVSRDGRTVYAGVGIDVDDNTYAGRIVALDALSGEKIWSSEKFSDYVWDVAELGTKHIVGVVETRGLVVLDKSNGKLLYEYPVGAGDSAYAVAVSDKYHGIIFSYYSGTSNKGYIVFLNTSIAVWPTSTSVPTTPHETTRPSNTTSIPATTSISGGAYWGVKWVSKPYIESETIYLVPDWTSVSPNDKYIAMTYIGKEHLRLTIIDTSNGRELYDTPLPVKGKYYWSYILWTPDSSKLIIFSNAYYGEDYSVEEYFILAYDLAAKKTLWVKYTDFQDVAVVDNDHILLNLGSPGEFQLISISTGEVVRKISLPEDIADSLRDYYLFRSSPNPRLDDHRVALGYNNYKNGSSIICLLDPYNPENTIILGESPYTILKLQYAANGKYLLVQLKVSEGNYTSLIIDANTGKLVEKVENAVLLQNNPYTKLIGLRSYENTYTKKTYLFYNADTSEFYKYEPKCVYPYHVLSNGDIIAFTRTKENGATTSRLIYLEKGLTSKPNDYCGETTTSKPTSQGAVNTTQARTTSRINITTTQFSIIGLLTQYLLIIIIVVVIVIIVLIILLLGRRRKKPQYQYYPPPPPPPPGQY